jgi:hypothetical protein
MSLTIKDVFTSVGRDVSIDAALLKRIHSYQTGFVNRNADHIAFFGGNLMGVHTMRFRTTDREDWFNEVLQMDEMSVVDGISEVAAIDAAWKRANDVMNLSCIWLLHAILKSTKLTVKQKEEGCMDVLLVLQYKFLGSLMAWYYRYPADEATMQATFARLSRKYALKAAGSWSALLHQRAAEILRSTSIHHRTYTDFNRDKDIIYMVSDIQGRLREIVKSMTAVFYQVREEGARISSENSVVDIDGSLVLKDKTRNYSTMIRYAHTVISNKNSFVRPELVKIILDAMPTAPERPLVETLEWMSVNHKTREMERIDKLISETLIFAFNLMLAERNLSTRTSDPMVLLQRLRGLYTASRMSDSTLLLTKQLSEEIVSKAVSTRNNAVIASIRTSVQLYIVLRTLAMNYYQG